MISLRVESIHKTMGNTEKLTEKWSKFDRQKYQTDRYKLAVERALD